MTKIAFIGFGEVGQRFSRDLMGANTIEIAAYDILFDDPRRAAARREVAREIGVAASSGSAEACQGANVVISAVTADQAEAVAKDAARYLAPEQIFLDVNSASPSTKRRAAAHVEPSGAHYVEGAVMAAVSKPGIRVPILAGGPAAGRAADALNRLGMNLTPVAREYGRASAIKLCRSIVIKGLEALMVDCARASGEWRVEAEVYESLAGTFPSIDWPKLAIDMAERVSTHGIRRAAEMREAAEMLGEMGVEASLARAVADAHQRGARTGKAE